ncbi:di-trans,poly-cis-decaprenylcistransferase [Patescibacteria group bacterium]|nr:di-trans,poly-cis-decaprenylcistransferase [Patescibacteria group bacterium]
MKKKEKSKKIPYHIVLFPDGNRRWARKKGLPNLAGHQQGYKNLKKFARWCGDRGVKILTAFGFSTENWKRSKKEVNYLMGLFEQGLSNKGDIGKLHKEGVKIKIIGQKERLPKSLQKIIKQVENLTRNNKKLRLNLAVSYGGRWDILQAIQKIIKEKVPAKKITENLFENFLLTTGLPTPDLVIRAGGEKRLSNFLLWQAAYSELYFSKKLWPDFTKKDLDEVLKEFSRRKRRFGGDAIG